MPVTKAKRRRPRSETNGRRNGGVLSETRKWRAGSYGDLRFLCEFLNIDFGAPPQRQANADSAYVISFLNLYASEESLAEARSIQAELISDLAFITDQDETNEQKIARGLQVLVDFKITELDLRYRLAYEQIHSEPPPLLFTRRQGILKLHGSRWIVRNTYTPRLSLREQLFWTIAASLENGEISDLKRCLECQKFFLITHGNQKVCARCEKVHESKGARDRVRRYRERLRKEEAELLEKKGMPTLERLMALARKTRISIAEDDEIFAIDNDREIFDFVARKIRANPSKEKIWRNLKMNQRKILAGIWRPR